VNNNLGVAGVERKEDAGEISFEERKNINRMISRAEKNVTVIENRISELENKLEEMDALLADSSRITSDAIFQDYENSKVELSEIMNRWEEAHYELEEWKSKKRW
jgi:ATP-binding cassette subfamily F protein 3